MMDDVSNQGRMTMDADADVVLKDDKEEDETEPAEVQEITKVVTTAKLITEVVTAASETITAASTIITAGAAQVPAAPVRVTAAPRGRKKGVVIRDTKEYSPSIMIPTETKSKDKGKGILVEEPKPLKKQAQIKQDEQFDRELEAKLNRNIDWDKAIDHMKKKVKEDLTVKKYQVLKRKPQTESQARKNMIGYLINVAGFKMDYFKGMSYDDICLIFEAKFNSNVAFLQKIKEEIKEEDSRALKRINETLTKRAAKRQKLDEDVEELKRHLQIMPNEDDDVYTEATPLARKVPVVDYQIIELNNKPYYKIIRADDTHQLYACSDLEESKKCTWSNKGQGMEAIGIMWCVDHNFYNYPADFVSKEEVPTHNTQSRSDAKCTLHAHEMLLELKTLFAQQAEQELLYTMRDFHSCKQEEGQLVSSYVLMMKGYIDSLERLGYPVTLGLGVSLILIGLGKEFDGFVQNYNMHSLGKTINELHAMLKLHEKTLPENNAPALHAI
nr:zinc finger, CCHC-type [Tanacetum cinerariifolium]